MKKAILVVSFGTTYKDTRKLTIDKIEDTIRRHFNDCEIRRAYTSHKVIEILRKRDGIVKDTPEEALEKLADDGFEEVIVQPLHMIPGEEYDYVKSVVCDFKKLGRFNKIILGRPILFYERQNENLPDDYSVLVDAVHRIIPHHGALVFMGHGTAHPSNACYPCLQSVFYDKGYKNVYIATVEGYPALKNVIAHLKEDKVTEVTLAPLMVVAGDHAKNDMAGEKSSSWENVLKGEGFKVNIYMHGLGEIDEFQNIYVEHIEYAIKNEE